MLQVKFFVSLRRGFQYAYEKYRDEADWFLKVSARFSNYIIVTKKYHK